MTPMKLARYFDTTPRSWLRLQKDYGPDVASDVLGKRFNREVHSRIALQRQEPSDGFDLTQFARGSSQTRQAR